MRTIISKTCRFSFVLILSLSQFSTVLAQNELPDSVVEKRIQIIQQMLDEGKPNANLWWNGWLIGYSSATVIQGAVYFSSNDNALKQDMALGAATTFLGAFGQVITPMVPGYVPDELAKLPENTHEERAHKLQIAEKLLKLSAEREIEGKSWQTHIIAGAVNLGSGLIVWKGFKRSLEEGIINFLINTAIAEIQIWTLPNKAISDYEKYQKIKSGEELSFHKEPQTSWSIVAYPTGIGVYFHF